MAGATSSTKNGRSLFCRRKNDSDQDPRTPDAWLRRSDAQLLHFLVVILAIEYVPLQGEPETASQTKRIDKGLILKALGEKTGA